MGEDRRILGLIHKWVLNTLQFLNITYKPFNTKGIFIFLIMNIQQIIWLGLLPILVMGGYIVALIRNIRKYK